MSKTMIDVLIAVCRKAAVGDPVSVWGIAQSTKKALERRKLVRRRWLGNTRKGRWVLQPTPLGRGFATAYDLGFARGQIRQRNDEEGSDVAMLRGDVARFALEDTIGDPL